MAVLECFTLAIYYCARAHALALFICPMVPPSQHPACSSCRDGELETHTLAIPRVPSAGARMWQPLRPDPVRCLVCRDGDLEIYTLAIPRVPFAWREDARWRGAKGGGNADVVAHCAQHPSRYSLILQMMAMSCLMASSDGCPEGFGSGASEAGQRRCGRHFAQTVHSTGVGVSGQLWWQP